MSYIIEGKYGSLTYWVQEVGDSYQWNGLKDNAHRFKSYTEANRVASWMQTSTLEITIKPAYGEKETIHK